MDNEARLTNISELLWHRMIAGFILLITLIINLKTMAPTLSFWDCGEFIACASILGIPHPPGSPLYIILGRVFSIMPFFADISARINFLSAASGAVAAMLAYLVTFRMIKYWYRSDDFVGWPVAIARIGAIIGASMFAFGKTNWNNSVEAEVYTLSMMILILIVWSFLNWLDNHRSFLSDRWLVLITFLGFLSTGIHMTVFLFLPAIFLGVIIASPKFRKDFRFYITGFSLLLVTVNLDWFLWASALWLTAVIIGSLISKNRMWKFSLAMMLAMIIGFSAQLYTPIRSAEKPSINQNNPSSSYAAFRNFLERKQYSQENMVVRAMTRRAEWGNQLGNFPRMGFWGFFSDQYGVSGRAFAFVFVIGAFGIFELLRRKPSVGGPLLLMLFLGTLFLIWYMNFADGTMQNPTSGDGHIEVRDRDYFFTPGFVLFGIAIGLGVAGLMETARESLPRSGTMRTVTLGILSGLILFSAAPVVANYHESDRSGNYIPYDFARNLLMSCDYNAVLFIAGDNDTFPIWCAQEVYGIRPDVKAVNLALSNADWYMQQIRDYMKLPLNWSDKEIAAKRHKFTAARKFYRIQDQVADALVDNLGDSRSINYAITVPTEAQQYGGTSIADNLIMRGMIYKFYKDQNPGRIDMDASYDLLSNCFDYRSIADTTVFKDARTASLMGNYATGFVLMAESLRIVNRQEEAISIIKEALEIVPTEYATYKILTQLYVETGREDLIPDILNRVPKRDQRQIYFVWGISHQYLKNYDRARELLKSTLERYPGFKKAFWEYGRILYDAREYDLLRQITEKYITDNPSDNEARSLLRDIIRRQSQGR